MDYNSFESLIESFKTLNIGRKYWLVRTMGGAFYGDFLRNGYIAVGYNKVSLESLLNLPQNENQAKEALKRVFSDSYPEVHNTGYPVSQLLHFVRNINVGDIVVIPSVSANHAAIGIVKSEMYEEEFPLLDSEHRCDFKKRRKIDWLLHRRRSQLPPMLQLMFNSRHILSDVSAYAPYLDSVTNDFYRKDDVAHLVLRIATRDEVSFDDFCDLQAIKKLITDMCQHFNLGLLPEDLDIKMKIQMESPGWLRLSACAAVVLFLFGVSCIALAGGGLEHKDKDGSEFKMSTDGVLKSISDYLDREADRELTKAATRALDSLKIQTPKDLESLINLIDKKNEIREKY